MTQQGMLISALRSHGEGNYLPHPDGTSILLTPVLCNWSAMKKINTKSRNLLNKIFRMDSTQIETCLDVLHVHPGPAAHAAILLLCHRCQRFGGQLWHGRHDSSCHQELFRQPARGRTHAHRLPHLRPAPALLQPEAQPDAASDDGKPYPLCGGWLLQPQHQVRKEISIPVLGSRDCGKIPCKAVKNILWLLQSIEACQHQE